MRRKHPFAALLLVAATVGCGGGGGGGVPIPPAAIWGQFRQNNQRTGLAFGITEDKDAIVDFEIVDPPTVDSPSPISSSPAIDADGRIYVASEGGTLAGFEGPDDLNRLWTVNRCDICPAGDQKLGRLISSPAVYTYEDINGVTHTSVFLGSADGAVFLYQLEGDDQIVDPSDCQVCFWRGNPALKSSFLASDPGANVSASFTSSPTFTANLGTGSIAGIFIGATITIEHSDGSTETQGKLYAINQDGSLRWEYPRAGDGPIAPVTSSPAFSVGTNLYFTTTADPNSPAAGDLLYSLTEAGNLKRIVSIPGLTDPALLLQPSPMSASTVFITSVDGNIHAMNPDGTFLWAKTIEGERFTSSLVVGSQNLPTETAAPTETPTPTGTLIGPSTTPTPTETPFLIDSNVLGITESGRLIVLNSRNGDILSPTGRMPSAAVEGTVVSSPALTSDLFMVFGTTSGQLFSINSANAQFPRFCIGGSDDGNLCTDESDCVDGTCGDTRWPILLPRSCNAGPQRSRFCKNDDECPEGACVRPAIRSSPSIDLDGTIYVGADDGRIYAIDQIPTPSPLPSLPGRPSATATQTQGAPATTTPTMEPTPTATSEATPTVQATPTETIDVPPSSTVTPTMESIDTPTVEATAEPTTSATASEVP